MIELKSDFLCTLTGTVAPPREIGGTPRGNRRFFAVTGGSFEGPRLRGEVLPEGGDWLIIRPDGVVELDVRATLRTDDGALIYLRQTGLRRATPEVQARLARGEAVVSDEYYFRVVPTFETSAPQYAWLNSVIAIGVGERLPDGVSYRMYEIL
jgi:hypothetical protein